jgi:hypothetical protein
MALPYQIGVGIGGHFPNLTNTDLTNAASTGVQWVRCDIGWSTIDPNLGNSPSYQASAATLINTLTAEAAAQGLKFVIPVSVGAGGGLFPNTSTPAAYGAMMAWIAGQCPGNTWEILNEPDYSGTSAALYTQVVQAAYPAMKAADPTCTVIAGVLSNISAGGGYAYWSSCYTNGVKGYYDIVSVHTYNRLSSYPTPFDPGTQGAGQTALLQAFQALIVTNSDSVPVWITEFGWDSFTGNSDAVTQQQQAAFLVSWFKDLVTLNIPVALMYKLTDDSSDAFGLMTNGYAPKPAYYAIKGLTNVPTNSVRSFSSGSSHFRVT